MAGIDGGHAWPQVPTGGVGGESTKQPEDQYLRSSTPIGLKAWRIFGETVKKLVFETTEKNNTKKARKNLYVH